jgi:hypothetical protein
MTLVPHDLSGYTPDARLEASTGIFQHLLSSLHSHCLQGKGSTLPIGGTTQVWHPASTE